MARLGPLTIGLPEIAITAAFVLPLIGATLPTALKVAGDPIGSATQLLTGLTRALATTDVEQETNTLVIASDALNTAAGNKTQLGGCKCKEGSTPNIVDLHDGDCVCVPIKNSGDKNNSGSISGKIAKFDEEEFLRNIPSAKLNIPVPIDLDIIRRIYDTETGLSGISGGLGR